MKSKSKSILLIVILSGIILFMGFVLLGVIAVAVAPTFVDLTKNASEAEFHGTVGAINASVLSSYGQSLVDSGTGTYPATLDDEAEGPCANCFSKVLSEPVKKKNWLKTGPLAYSYQNGGFTGSFTYDPASGELKTE